MNIREFILSYIKDGNTIINQGYDIEKKFDSISLNELHAKRKNKNNNFIIKITYFNVTI